MLKHHGTHTELVSKLKQADCRNISRFPISDGFKYEVNAGLGIRLNIKWYPRTGTVMVQTNGQKGNRMVKTSRKERDRVTRKLWQKLGVWD